MCQGKRTRSSKPAPPQVKFTGSGSLVKLEFIGESEEPFVGFVTGFIYPFHTKKVLYVDRSDLVYLLGSEFVELS